MRDTIPYPAHNSKSCINTQNANEKRNIAEHKYAEYGYFSYNTYNTSYSLSCSALLSVNYYFPIGTICIISYYAYHVNRFMLYSAIVIEKTYYAL